VKVVEFWNALKVRGITFFSGVPDSTFQEAYHHLAEDPDFSYIPAVREDVALGIASAAYFDGRLGGVVMQNSGIGNIVNPLTSFSLLYKIPVLLVIGWRGYGGAPNDAPEHWIMGAKTAEMLGRVCKGMDEDYTSDQESWKR
jgi:sulfopyruvate decarboxylase TPP-binding subunit